MKFVLQTFFKGLFFFLTDKNFRTFVWLCVRYGNSARYKQKKIRFSEYKITVADARSFIWQYYEIFFKGYYHFHSEKPNPVIIDCGSNIGLSLIHFKKQYPNSQVFGFEADAEICKILHANTANNGCNDITVFNQAVWTKDEEIYFQSEGADGGQISDNTVNSNKIDAIDLNRFLERFEHIDFLKIDIEGAEATLLPHIAKALHKVDHIFVEFHSYNNAPQHLKEVINAITMNGHRIYIDNVTFKNRPFINKTGKYGMDLQLNIFAYKN